MSREEWKLVLCMASTNISKDIIDIVTAGGKPSQAQLVVQELIDQIFKAL